MLMPAGQRAGLCPGRHERRCPLFLLSALRMNAAHAGSPVCGWKFIPRFYPEGMAFILDIHNAILLTKG